MAKKEQMESKIGNMTCVLRECGVLDSENNFNSLEAILTAMEDFKVRANNWVFHF